MQAAALRQVTNLETIKLAIADKMDSAGFRSWIDPLGLDVESDTLFLRAHNQFAADFIKNVYSNVLTDVASGFGLGMHICVAGGPIRLDTTANDNMIQKFIPAPVSVAVVNTFDEFIMSDENTFVVSACKKMASGTASFSPLFIYGPSGSGKSLLVECINDAAVGRTLVMTGSQFLSEFQRAIREHSVFAFKDFCRNCDTFILDDLHILAGKRATTEEFVHLIMDLRASGKSIILTSNTAPGNMSGFDRRVQSLLASGLVADVSAPTNNVKKTMLVRSGIAIDVAEMLSGRIGGDGHLIGGVAKKIATYTELMGEHVTADVAERLLADMLQKNKTPLSMVKSMCDKLGVSFDQVCGTSRTRTIVRARQIMMVALKTATKLSLSEIGRLVGDRDHATVLYAIAQIDKAKSSDLILVAQIDQMVGECR